MKVPNPMNIFDDMISLFDKYYDYWPYALAGMIILIGYMVAMNLGVV